jgi:L-methionine (R)-S-oxide reductase
MVEPINDIGGYPAKLAFAPRHRAEMTENKPELYRELAEQLAALLAGETNLIANAANAAALIYHTLPDINWAGFYFHDGEELVLGSLPG